MSQIEPTDHIPNLDWQDHFRHELEAAADVLAVSDFVGRIGNVASFGYIYYSLMAPPWMWFLLAKNVSFKDLIDFRRLAVQIPKDTKTTVRLGHDEGFKFAKFYGFVETDEVLTHRGVDYRVMRKV